MPFIRQTPPAVHSLRPPSFSLPDGWEFAGETSEYPNPQDIVSIRQWIHFLIGCANDLSQTLSGVLLPDFDYPDARNAHRIVRHLCKSQGWKNPPQEPRRKFTTTKEDLLALGHALEDVQKWIDSCLEARTTDQQPRENDPRDEWIYAQRKAGIALKKIKLELSRNNEGWFTLETVQAVNMAAKRYAMRKNLPWPIPRD